MRSNLEVKEIATDGLHLLTEETFRMRLEAQVVAGTLTAQQVRSALAASPLTQNPWEPRAGQICTTALPIQSPTPACRTSWAIGEGRQPSRT